MLKLTPEKKRGSSLALVMLYASLVALLGYSMLQLLALQQLKQLWESSQNEKFTNPDTM